MWEVARPAEATKLWSDYLAAVAKLPTPTQAFKPGSATHRGVKLALLVATPTATMPADQRVFYDRMGGKMTFGLGAVAKRVVFSLGTDMLPRAKALIDRSKGGKARAQPMLAAILAEARRRSESYVITVDAAALHSRFQSMLGNGPGPTPVGTMELARSRSASPTAR